MIWVQIFLGFWYGNWPENCSFPLIKWILKKQGKGPMWKSYRTGKICSETMRTSPFKIHRARRTLSYSWSTVESPFSHETTRANPLCLRS